MIQKINAPVASRVATLPITMPAIAPPPSPSFLFAGGASVGVASKSVVEEDDIDDVVEDVVEDVEGIESEPPSLPVMLNATATVNPDAAAHP